jgi:hypothetical protein
VLFGYPTSEEVRLDQDRVYLFVTLEAKTEWELVGIGNPNLLRGSQGAGGVLAVQSAGDGVRVRERRPGSRGFSR